MRPSLAGVIARCASAAQNLRSQASARPSPPPTATPRITAMVGRSRSISALRPRGDRRRAPPHRPDDRVATLRAVENDAGERRLEAQGNIGHEVLEARRTRRFRPSLALLRTETDGAERRWGGSLRPGARGAELSDR